MSLYDLIYKRLLDMCLYPVSEKMLVKKHYEQSKTLEEMGAERPEILVWFNVYYQALVYWQDLSNPSPNQFSL